MSIETQEMRDPQARKRAFATPRSTLRGRAVAAAWAVAASLAPPALRALLAWRVRIGKEDPDRLDERRGLGTPPPETWHRAARRVWLHAASVGETVSVLPVIERLLSREDVAVLVTTGTLSSTAILEARAPLPLGGRLSHRFAPHDTPRAVARLLDRWRPDVAGFVDSEIWPNTLAALARRGIPALMVNARLSARSGARWQSAARLLGGTPFGLITAVLARSAEDSARIAALGGPEAVMVGDLKQAAPALPADPAALAALRAEIGKRPVWLAASTHPGEEAAIARVHARLAPHHPGLLTLIAPRHPDRGAAIAAELGGVRRRSAREALPERTGLYLWDTLGELGMLYRAARVVFVGHSLLGQGGGHNPYEPARCEAAVATGRLTGNFNDAVRILEAAGALTVVADEAALADWVAAMLADPMARMRSAQAAAAIFSTGRDLPERVAEALLAQAVPVRTPA